MPTLAEILNDAVDNRRLLKAVLSRPRRTASPAARKVVIRPIQVRGDFAYQFAVRVENRETHENLPPRATAARVIGWCESTFTECHLVTTDAEYSIRVSSDGRSHVKRRPAKHEPPASVDHDRVKPYLIPDGTPCPFLIETGVMTAAGNVRSAKHHKFRQVNRFLELVEDVVESLPPDGPLNIVDFGCGKSYLTFALHHLLTVVHGRDVGIVGLDRNPDVVAGCNRLTESLGMHGLTFRREDIADFQGFGEGNRIDLVVSLHACDTATDDALAEAVRWNAGAIFAVPCCQHEIAGTMTGDRLRAVTRHGILKERLAAIATDALRAEVLEECGYRTQVVEFIDLEHTAKNVLIRAVRRPAETGGGIDRSENIQRLKETLGISRFRLEDALEGITTASISTGR